MTAAELLGMRPPDEHRARLNDLLPRLRENFPMDRSITTVLRTGMSSGVRTTVRGDDMYTLVAQRHGVAALEACLDHCDALLAAGWNRLQILYVAYREGADLVRAARNLPAVRGPADDPPRGRPALLASVRRGYQAAIDAATPSANAIAEGYRSALDQLEADYAALPAADARDPDETARAAVRSSGDALLARLESDAAAGTLTNGLSVAISVRIMASYPWTDTADQPAA